MTQILKFLIQPDFLFSIIIITAPILLATLAALIAEKAGVTNIGLEGIMMISALFGALGGYWFKSWFSGMMLAAAIGILIGIIMAFFSLNLKTDIILSGIAVNMIGGGGTIFLLYAFTKERGNTASLSSTQTLIPTVNIPLLKDIPFIGDVLSGHSFLTYLSFLLVLAVWILLYKTPLGLNIRAVGEDENAAKSVGVSVIKIKYIALAISGFLAGLGGAFMSMYYSQSFNSGMVAGRGFIALAAEAMGKSEPLGAMLSSLLFGLAQALRSKVSGIQNTGSYLVSSIPYVVTIVGLFIYAAGTVHKFKKRKAKNNA